MNFVDVCMHGAVARPASLDSYKFYFPLSGHPQPWPVSGCTGSFQSRWTKSFVEVLDTSTT